MFFKYCKEFLKFKLWFRRYRMVVVKWYIDNFRYFDNFMFFVKYVIKYRRRYGFLYKKVLKCCYFNIFRCFDDIKFILCYVVKGILKVRRLY